MKSLSASLLVALLVSGAILSGCAPAAPPPAPTKAPAAVQPTAAPKAAEPTKPAEPTKAPAAAQPTAAPAKAEEFPIKGKPISIIVPFAAGGAMDLATRVLAPLMEKELGTPVEVVNKPGAGSQTGSTELVKSKPDGHTLGMVSFAGIFPTYLDPERQAVYSRKDFQPVAHYAFAENVMAVKPNGPYKDLKELVTAAKPDGAGVSVGTVGLMSNTHIAALKLQVLTGAKLNWVNFDGTPQAITALLGDHIGAASVSTGDIMSQYKSGAVRVVGIMGKQPSKFFPDVKTYESQGYKVYHAYSFGLAGPAGMPRGAADALAAAAKKAIGNPDLVKRLEELGMDTNYMDPTQFATFWADSEAEIKPLIDLAKSIAKK